MTLFHGFREATLDVGITIHVRVGGDGPPVLLLHGFPQNMAMWARVAPLLARRYTVVCADLRGYGDSGKPPPAPDASNYSFRAFAQDQVAAMRRLGFERFHVVGHDRGARTAHRMALDHPDTVLSVALLDIVPTLAMFDGVDQRIARAYWHWYFLQQPAPYPEKVIAAHPDHFFEGCLAGWGATRLQDFDPEQLGEYRRTWRMRDCIFGMCADYRAAAHVDVELDRADAGRRVTCPTLVFWGSTGLMANLFDMHAVWAPRIARMQTASLPGGHFFVDQFPGETTAILEDFLG